MFNESKRKKKDHSAPTRWQLIYRTAWECFRRSVTVYLMYLFMSLLALACSAIDENGTNALEIVLQCLCIAGGVAFNVHLCYNFGKTHYGFYVVGEIRRKNALFGIQSGTDHTPEREYRVWKGFLIGFFAAIPAFIIAIVTGTLQLYMDVGRLNEIWAYASFLFIMLAGWAYLPITWFGTAAEGVGIAVSGYWSLLIALLPVLVSGIAYLIGAFMEQRDREKKAARERAIEEAGRRAKEEMEARAAERAINRKKSKKK